MRCLVAALRAVEPGALVARTLATVNPSRVDSCLAVGKAAGAMADAARQWKRSTGRPWESELVVAPWDRSSASTANNRVPGDHPIPGTRSGDAADAVGRLIGSMDGERGLLLLLSGGTSSLIGAPVPGITDLSLATIFREVLASGLAIHEANAVRKRFLRWGAGRLAQVLHPSPVLALALSDVPYDEPGSIGSGPVTPDPLTAADVEQLVSRAGLGLPADALALLSAQRRGSEPETPKPGDPYFDDVEFRVIGDNQLACRAAAAQALSGGWPVAEAGEALHGEAREAGARFARRLIAAAGRGPVALVSGGETVVALGANHGTGGRNHEFALAAARELNGHPDIVVLACGTDGRDGGTAAAGALVDGHTWTRVGNGDAVMARHDTGTALAAIGAAMITGPTGTNVMDLAIGLAGPGVRDATAMAR